MNLDDDDDSVFEQALRADLPTMSQQNRLRQRLLAAGVAAGTALGSTNVAAATQASFAASALSKLSALSWPAKLGLTAVLAAPVAALPLVYAPIHGAAIVSQVRSSVATVHARSVTKTLSHAKLPSLEAAETAHSEREPERERESEPTPVQAMGAAGVMVLAATPRAPVPSPAANGSASATEPAVAAFDSVAHEAPAKESERLPSESTLAAETELLDRAFAALSTGDRSTASALVAEHARLFPNGLLRQERERARARLATDPKGE